MKKLFRTCICLFVFFCCLNLIQIANAAQKTHCPGGSNCPGIGYFGTNSAWSNDTVAWARRIGLNIDIYSGQFKVVAASSPYAYAKGSCVWFATSRIREITGRTDISTYGNASAWWGGWAETYGYTKGSAWPVGLQKALAVYTNHVQVIEAVEGDNVLISEGNGYFSGNDCTGVVWKTKSQIENYRGGGFGNFIGFIYLMQSKGSLEVSGILDGANNPTTDEYGTFDVYINNILQANDVNDYSNSNLSAGSTYKITDIKEKDGYSYDGNYNIEGTISAGNTSTIRLPFNSCILEVNGRLDGVDSYTLGSFGTFDVILDGWTFCDDCNSFNQRLTKGTTYEISDIKPKNGYGYESVYSGNKNGTISSGTKKVRLSFYSIGELSCDWIETDKLPGNVNSDNCEIQYNNHYQTTASSSPGSGWEKADFGTIQYQNVGDVYESDIALPTSDTREFVGYYYYHYCGNPSHREWAEHYYRPEQGYTNYHDAKDIDSYDEDEVHVDDSGNADYLYYLLKWNTGQWNGGVATCPDGSKYWYKMFQYQDKQAVTYYTWVKDSGWSPYRNSGAVSFTIRYRLKNGCGNRGITLPNGLKQINDSAFEGSTTIEEVYIPNGVTTIGARAFANCPNLFKVRIPDSITSIGANAFVNNPNVVLYCQSYNKGVEYASNNNIAWTIE